MPVTTTAKRALRSSIRKATVNKLARTKLEIAIRLAQKSKSEKDVSAASSLSDRLAKKRIIHKNKAARIKSQLAKLSVKKTVRKSKTSKK